ncbi:MAG TPA: phosphotransferase family protein [Acidimicrobiales bacterium]|nr:phosphotransferase family protein [Acidimicrobiales bacterium]
MTDDTWTRAKAWIEATIGGRVVEEHRQPRWRPAWFVDVELTNGKMVPLYWRGDRGLVPGASPLRIESDVLEILEDEHIPVPHVYGYCPDPAGILMARVPGEVDFHRAATDEQESVADDFLHALAQWHKVDPARFETVGLRRPTTPQEHALFSLDKWERLYRSTAAQPAPLIEFALGWLHRNVPETTGGTVLVHGDNGPGQFLFEKARVTAVLDWEFCHLGDPMEDLALIRGRDVSYPFGDLRKRFARYAELSGNAIDLARLRYYSVLAMVITPVGLYPVLAHRPAGADFAQVLAWNSVFSRTLLECMAEAADVRLGLVEIPEPTPTTRAWIHDSLVDALRNDLAPRQGDDFDRYKVEAAALLADHLRLADELGPALDAADLDDAAKITGTRHASRVDSDAALQETVIQAGPDRDEELIRFFYRRTVRDEILLAPLLGELSETATLRPIA